MAKQNSVMDSMKTFFSGDSKNVSALESFQHYITKQTGISPEMLTNLMHTFIIILVVLLLKGILKRYFYGKIPSEDLQKTAEKLVPKIINFMTLGVLLKIWFVGQAGLGTILAISTESSEKIISSLYIIMFYLLVKEAVVSLIPLVGRYDIKKQYTLIKYSNITIGLLSVFFMIKLWFAGEANLSTYFGLLSAGLAIALQDVITSLAGWAYILVIKPLAVGDRIKIGDNIGDVVDIQAFQFSIQELNPNPGEQQPTGRIIHIPNKEVFKLPVANYNAGFDFVWHEMPILITFESDWRKTKAVLEKILIEQVGKNNAVAEKQIRDASKNFQMSFGHLDSKVWINVLDSGVLITMRFLVDPKEIRSRASLIWETILDEFAKHGDIDFAYPTQRIYYNGFEGKPGARQTFPYGEQGISINSGTNS